MSKEFGQKCLVPECDGDDIQDVAEGLKRCRKCGAEFSFIFSCFVATSPGNQKEIYRQLLGYEGKWLDENFAKKRHCHVEAMV